jgi:hypothetical protein
MRHHFLAIRRLFQNSRFNDAVFGLLGLKTSRASGKALWVVFFLCAAAPVLHPHALTFSGGIDNFSFYPYITGIQSTFVIPSPALALNININGEFSTFAYYNVGFELDPILRYYLRGDVSFNLGFFRLGVGAFLSMFNTGTEEYVPGVIGGLGIEIPLGLSLYIEYGLNTNIDLDEVGNINLNYGKIEAVAGSAPVRGRFVMQRKSFLEVLGNDRILKDSLVRYQGTLDFLFKPSPLLMSFGGGYQTLVRSVNPTPNTSSTVSGNEKSVEMGFFCASFTLAVNPRFELLLNMDVPLSVPIDYFKACAGISLIIAD